MNHALWIALGVALLVLLAHLALFLVFLRDPKKPRTRPDGENDGPA